MRDLTSEEVQAMSLEEAKGEMMNAVYLASLLFERLEDAGKVNGNGHHAAQKVARFAADELERRWRKLGIPEGCLQVEAR